MSYTNGRNHSLSTSLLLQSKRDLKGRTLTDEERLLTKPWHQFWETEAAKVAGQISSRVGRKLFNRLIAWLPEEANHWSYQKWAFLFRRVLSAIDSAPMGKMVRFKNLQEAAIEPIYPHPITAKRHSQLCPECGSNTVPFQIDGNGYGFHCVNGHRWTASNEDSTAQWVEHVSQHLLNKS
jgi:hypothetical protein